MSAAPYIFPAQQAEFLRALRDGRYRTPARTHNVPASSSLISRMPPIYEQALRGTCVSNAVTAMLEYYEDCKTRLSVQYLFAATKEVERAALERNLSRLRRGEPLDPEFEHLHHSKLLQLRMMADANGGINATVMRPYLSQFEEMVRTRYEQMEGSLLRSCFNVLEYRGTCRYSLWPYAGVSAAPLFGPGERIAYPPGSDEDAKKHRVLSGLYLLPAPNNVDEIRGILAGVNDRRPMPVCVTVSFFAGCDGETFTFPRTEETPDGLAAKDAWLGVHGMLIVGYVDNAAAPGGGYFIVRNSLGEAWGNRGYGKLPYAYVACFALESGTILQELVDYTGDGYGGLHPDMSYGSPRPRRRKWLTILNILVAAVLVAGTGMVVKWYLEPKLPPYKEVTVYGRDSTVNNVTLPSPWDNVKGEAIDGGVVFRLPVKTKEDVDVIRRKLDAEPTLREKRGKELTYDLVSFFDLVSDDLDGVRNIVGKFRAESLLVRTEGVSNGVLRVSTISPRGFEQRLKQEFNIEPDGHGRWRLTSKAGETRSPAPETGETRSPASETGGTRSRASENVEDPPVTNDLVTVAQEQNPSVSNDLAMVAQEQNPSVSNDLATVVQEQNPSVSNDLATVVQEQNPSVSNDLTTVAQEQNSSVSNDLTTVAQELDPPVVTKNVPSLPVVVQELDFSAVSNIPPIVVHEFGTPAVTNVLPQMIVPENDPPVSNDLSTVAQERDPPVVTKAPSRPVVSVTDEPAPIVSVTDMPKPPVVSMPDESNQVVIVGKNGVIARFGRVAKQKPAKSDDSVPVSNSLPAKVEGEPPIIRSGVMPSGRTDF